MTPIGPSHASCVKRLNALFAPLVTGRATLSIQDPLVLDQHQEPQPDVVVLRYRADGYRARHPHAADVLLVIEVAETSVQSDRRIKIPLYARASVPEAWLVNLPGDRLEVYRQPAAGLYAKVTTHARGVALAPLGLPDFEVSVDQILGASEDSIQ
jgi:Uma2 family endonuclease